MLQYDICCCHHTPSPIINQLDFLNVLFNCSPTLWIVFRERAPMWIPDKESVSKALKALEARESSTWTLTVLLFYLSGKSTKEKFGVLMLFWTITHVVKFCFSQQIGKFLFKTIGGKCFYKLVFACCSQLSFDMTTLKVLTLFIKMLKIFQSVCSVASVLKKKSDKKTFCRWVCIFIESKIFCSSQKGWSTFN